MVALSEKKFIISVLSSQYCIIVEASIIRVLLQLYRLSYTSLKLRYALDTHLNFIVGKNHWNETARFQDIKDISLSSI